jgi:PKD repeat protein
MAAKAQNTTPSLVYPNNKAVLADSSINFQWNTVQNALQYELQLSLTQSFTNIYLYTQNINNPFLNIDTLSYARQYHWRVRAVTSAGPQNWSPIRSFTHFTPADLPGLSLWLIPDSAVLSGNKVTKWPNLVDPGISFDQPNANKQPILTNPIPTLNNHRAIRFDGTDDVLNAGDTLDLNQNSRTTFILGKSNAGNGSAFLAKSIAAGKSNRMAVFYNNNELRFLYQDLSNRNIFVPHPSGQYQVISTKTSRVSKINELYSNSLALGISSGLSGSSYSFNSPYRLLLGAFNDANDIGEILNLNGEIIEIVMVDEALNDSMRQLVEGYLYNKYAPPVNIGPDITIDYGFCDTVLNASTRFVNYQWNTGSTASNITVSQPGLYVVTVTDVFGFSSMDSVFVDFTVFPTIMDDTLICPGDTIRWHTNLSSMDYTFNWNNNSSLNYLDISIPGQYWVSITDTNGCVFLSDTITVTTDDYANTVSLGPDTAFCSGNVLSLKTGAAATVSYLWRGGSSDSMYAVDTSGLYWVQTANARGCKGFDTVQVQVKGIAPFVDFTADSVCLGSATAFTDLSSVQPPDGLKTWQWDFGDGNTANVQNPVHTYANAGVLNATLAVTSDSGCAASMQKPVLVNAPSLPLFTWGPGQQGCINVPLNFYDQTNVAAGDSIVNWLWDFGDNTQSNVQNPTHTYSSASNYTVQLTIMSYNGCSTDTAMQVNIVTSALIAEQFTLISPNNGFILSEDSIHFLWNVSLNAGSYAIEIATDPNFNNIVKADFTLKTQYTLSGIPQYGRYYWRVKALNNCLIETNSEIREFEYFQPTEIPGITLWLLPDSAILSGNKISKWPNLMDKGISFDQQDAAKQPDFVANIPNINFKPVLRFDGSKDVLNAGDTMDLNKESRTLFIVGKSNTGTGSTFLAKAIAAGKPNRYAVFYNNNELRFLYDDISTKNIFTPYQAGNYQIITTITDRFDVENRLFSNSNLLDSISGINGNGYDFNSNYRFLIGAYNDAGDVNEVNYLKGDIAEIIMYDAALNDADRQKVENYLRYKYAPPVVLPPDISIEYGFCDTTIFAYKPWFVSYQWNTGAITSTISVNKPGKYVVTVTDVFGFGSSDSLYLRHPAQFLRDTAICLGQTLLYDTRLAGQPYQINWNTGDTTASIVISAEGEYAVTIRDTLGCEIRDTIYVDIDSFEIQATLGPDSIMCKGEPLNLKTGANVAAQYQWSTGEKTPKILVDTPGNYWLNVWSINGCFATDTITVGVKGAVPVVNFTTSKLCIGDTIQFTDQSLPVGTDLIIQWDWDLGDSTFTNVQHPRNYYADTGIYVVKLGLLTQNGCSNSLEKPVFINPLPEVNFTNTLPCHGNNTQFLDQSTVFNGIPFSWQWDFGDGTTSNFADPVKVFAQPGNYLITQIVASNFGCVDTFSRNILVLGSPIADFTWDTACFGLFTAFHDSTNTDLSSPVSSWQWTFGDGTFGNVQNPKHKYNAAGQYIVRMTARATNGCSTDTTKKVTVYETPDVGFMPDTVCEKTAFTFTDTTKGFGVPLNSWKWDFGNGQTDTVQNPVFKFDIPGNYPVKLRVINLPGCADSTVQNVGVFALPEAGFRFIPDFGAAPIDIEFRNEAVGGKNFKWFIVDSLGNDSLVGTQENPVVNFTKNGKYNIRQIVESAEGCFDTISDVLFIAVPVLDLRVDELFLTETLLPDGNYKVEISARIINTGTRKINDFDVIATLGNGSSIVEKYEQVFLPGASMIYSFHANFYVTSPAQQTFVCVETANPNGETDDIPENDRQCEGLAQDVLISDPFPNPTANTLTITMVLPIADQLKIETVNSIGQVVFNHYDAEADKGFHQFDLDMQSLDNGQYYLRITYREEQYVRKFVMQR